MRKQLLYAAVASLLAVCATSCDKTPKSTTTSGAMTMLCDDSFENIMEQEIDVFEYSYPNAHIGCQYVTQKECLDSLFAGATHTIVIGRDLTKSEFKGMKAKYPRLRSMKIAVDAVALIINPDNPVKYLSMNEIGEILAGETSNWDLVEPDAPNLPIEVVFDNSGSGLTNYMVDSLLDGRKFGPNVVQTGSIEGVLDRVKKSRGAIGVIGVSWLTRDLAENRPTGEQLAKELNDTTAISGVDLNEKMAKSGVKVLGVMRDVNIAFKPYQQNIYDGSYPLTRPIYMITTASPSGLAGGFYSFVTGVTGQRLMMKTGILPARVPINVYEVTN